MVDYKVNGFFETDRYELELFSRQYNIELTYFEEMVYITTPESKWIADFNQEKNTIDLYHKNQLVIFDNRSKYPEYHSQLRNVHSMKKILTYIVKHDEYRRSNPIKKYVDDYGQPLKSTKKKPSKGIKRRIRQIQTCRVLQIIDKLKYENSRLRECKIVAP